MAEERVFFGLHLKDALSLLTSPRGVEMRMLALFLLSLSLKVHALDCGWVWGEGKRLESDKAECHVEVGSGPALLRLPLSEVMNSRKILGMKLYLENPSQLQGLEFRLGKGSDWKKFKATHLSLFKDMEFNFVLPRQWNSITFSLSHFQKGNLPSQEYDTLYIFLENPSGVPLSFRVKDLRLRSKAQKKGWVSLTVDDGYESVYRAAQKMKKYGLTGTAYLIEKGVGRPGSLTSQQACAMKRWGWALGFHHETPFTEMDNLSEIFQNGKAWLKKLCKETDADHVAYPLGKQSADVRRQANSHFKSARLASGGLETLPPAQFMALRVFNVLSTTPAEEVLKQAREAIENGDWLILMFHYFKDDPESELDYSWAGFEEILKGLRPLAKSVKTVPEVITALD